MDLTPTPEQQSFRSEVREWLAANVPADPLPEASTPEGLAAHKAWERRLFEAGYAAIHWPSEYGGRDADHLTQQIFAEEYVASGAPTRINTLGLGLAGPTLMVYGTPEQKDRWLARILSSEDIW